MLKFSSESALRLAVCTVLLLLAGLTVGFYLMQNHTGLIGGEIALSKAVWLALAILFWLLLPALILMDGKTVNACRLPFAWLLGLMTARGVIEGLMLYVYNNWSPLYGIAHDVICLVVMGAMALSMYGRERQHQPTSTRRLGLHAMVTGLMFLPEMYYAWYMRANFHTQGNHAIYFVPDNGQHTLVLGVTTTVNLLLIAYLFWFVPRWLHDKTQSDNPQAA